MPKAARILNEAILTQQKIHDEALRGAGSAVTGPARLALHDIADAAMLAIRHLQNRLLAMGRPAPDTRGH
ncbi:hypothetical protein [Roseomonas gilardii]|uniref:hypothetical protein n=1 Tax=Roseomonas gilardii TaxID=257708 RepID=UPI0012EC9B45|nr:hypothetical protein [Roseomonas gilardii]